MQLSKVEIGYNTNTRLLIGLQFYSKDGAVVLKTESEWVAAGFPTHTVHLEDGERVIGI